MPAQSMAAFGIEYFLRQSTTLEGLVAVFATLGLVAGRRWRLQGRPLVGDLDRLSAVG